MYPDLPPSATLEQKQNYKMQTSKIAQTYLFLFSANKFKSLKGVWCTEVGYMYRAIVFTT
jgi:hypothetical protein